MLRGRDGDDVLFSLDGGDDRLNCGSGNDVAFADPGDVAIACEVVRRRNGTQQGAFRIRVGSNGGDIIDGGNNPDRIFGRAGDDILKGGDDDDFIFGGAGTDLMSGENDDDVIVDDDSIGGDSHDPGDGRDLMFAADGARDFIDCSDADDDGDGDVVFADTFDAVVDCGTVRRG